MKRRIMKRPILAAVLLLAGVAAAQADTSYWTALHPQLTDSDRVAANRICNMVYSAQDNGVPVSAAYKSCMRRHGWAFGGTKIDDNWINRHGMACHPILGGAGSTCDSVW